MPRGLSGVSPVPAVAVLAPLGRCLGHAPLGTQSTPSSTLRPHNSACSGGAGPPRPYPLSSRFPMNYLWLCPSHCLHLSSYTHVPLPLPLSLTPPPRGVLAPALAPPWTRTEGGREGGR